MKYTTDKITRFGFFGVAGIDTAFVILFLAMEYGRSAQMLSPDAILLAITLAMLIVLPYFLPSAYEKPLFGNWLLGRSVLALAGVGVGFAVKQNAGAALPNIGQWVAPTLDPEELEKRIAAAEARLEIPCGRIPAGFAAGRGAARAVRNARSVPPCAGVVACGEQHRQQHRRERAHHREGPLVRQALEQVRRLNGIVPICANCKNVRDDQGYWNRVEAYLNEHTEADFTHAVCPDCMKRLYPQFKDDDSTPAKKP